MNFAQFRKIITPIIPYIIILIIYFNFRDIGDFDVSKWNWYLGTLLMFVIPIILLLWFLIRFRAMVKKTGKTDIFLISAIPGLFPGFFIAYGFWQMGHGKYFIYLISGILQWTILSVVIFSLIGFLINIILNKIASKILK